MSTGTLPSGIRRFALEKNEPSNGGISDVSISSSTILSTRSQFVSEEFFKLRALILQCLSQGNDSNCTLIRLVKHNHDDTFFQEAYADEPRLRIVTGVCGNEHRQLKNLPCI